MSNNTILYYNSNGEDFTIEDYKFAVKCEDKKRLANFVYNRLYSRYIKPYEFSCEEYKKHYKNGFSMMASFCLLIETLQSFKEGIGDSEGKGKQLFINFFNEQKGLFGEFDGRDFYKNIRCGILHQGETTGSWKLNRKAKLEINEEKFCIKILYKEKENGNIEYDGKTIQVNNFMNAIKKVLENYRDNLKKEKFCDEKKYFELKKSFLEKLKTTDGIDETKIEELLNKLKENKNISILDLDSENIIDSIKIEKCLTRSNKKKYFEIIDNIKNKIVENNNKNWFNFLLKMETIINNCK